MHVGDSVDHGCQSLPYFLGLSDYNNVNMLICLELKFPSIVKQCNWVMFLCLTGKMEIKWTKYVKPFWSDFLQFRTQNFDGMLPMTVEYLISYIENDFF